MKLIILLIYTPFVYTENHIFVTTYTGVKGIDDFPSFFAVSTLDGQQLDYYDSDTQTLIPKQKWLKEFKTTDMWNEDTEIRKYVQQIYKNNIDVLMSRFNQSDGIHTYQRIYGCEWDNETVKSNGFDLYGYDGEDFIVLDIQNARYITALPQAFPTMHKWNEDRGQIESLLQYYSYDCAYWLKYFLDSRKDALKTTAPEVFLQKSPSSVSCHATGFYPSGVMISWMKNGEDVNEDVEIREHLPNEDGTFQKTSTLLLDPENWKKDEYICVVEHNMKKIQTILSVHEINEGPDILFSVTLYVMVILIIVLSLTYAALQKKRNFKPCIHDNPFDKHA